MRHVIDAPGSKFETVPANDEYFGQQNDVDEVVTLKRHKDAAEYHAENQSNYDCITIVKKKITAYIDQLENQHSVGTEEILSADKKRIAKKQTLKNSLLLLPVMKDFYQLTSPTSRVELVLMTGQQAAEHSMELAIAIEEPRRKRREAIRARQQADSPDIKIETKHEEPKPNFIFDADAIRELAKSGELPLRMVNAHLSHLSKPNLSEGYAGWFMELLFDIGLVSRRELGSGANGPHAVAPTEEFVKIMGGYYDSLRLNRNRADNALGN